MILLKNIFKYLGLFGIALCSFYYTEQVALYVKNKNPLMQEIKEKKESLYVGSTDSVLIEDLYIIPGLNGKEVNVNKSFSNMKEYEMFSYDALIFNQIIPSVSLEKNKERIIIRGNSKKEEVSLIFESNNYLANTLLEKKYQVNILLNKETYDPNYEMINNATNEKTYSNIDKYLTKNKLNKNLCYVKTSPSKNCKNKYLFKPSLTINHSNLSTTLNKIEAGEIILVEDSVTLSELELLIKQIENKNLKIVPLSILIDETNEID